MFIKIPSIFKTVDVNWNNFKSNICFEKYYSATRNGGSYFYTITDYPQFKDLLKTNIFTIQPDVLAYCEFTGEGLVKPHTDSGTSVSLNFYIDTDDGITIFYKKLDNIINSNFQNKKNLNYFENDSNLIEIGRFQAKNKECYLLDVTQFHGIQKTSNRPRSMITARWHWYKFADILNSLNFS